MPHEHPFDSNQDSGLLRQHVTQILDNVLYFLEEGRRTVERTNKKNCEDVRVALGDSYLNSMLSGIEGPVEYNDLTAIIDEFKRGVAVRRMGA